MPMSGNLLIGIDLGTTQVKTGVFDLQGNLHALARARYPVLTGDNPNLAEQDPTAWWAAVVTTLRQVTSTARGQIAALCCGGQGPTLVMTDRKGMPLHNAILWMDQRAQDEQSFLAERIGAGVSWSSLPNALWLKRHCPEDYARAGWFFGAWDYIAFRLCGCAVTSTQRSRASLSAEVIDQAGLNPSLFPPPAVAGTVIGHLMAQAASETGLPSGLPIVAGASDGTASFLGAGLVVSGRAVDAGGTSGGFGLCQDRQLSGPGIMGGEGLLPGLYICGGAMGTTGKALDWYSENILNSTLSIEELIASAAETPPGAEGLIFLPYLAGERSPHWDPHARGVFCGLTLRHDWRHMGRAILEGAAFALRDVAQRVLDSGGRVSEMRVCGGPARSEVWNQIKADITGFRVAVPRVTEVALLGTAILAGLGVGLVPNMLSGVENMVFIDHYLEPQPEHRERYEQTFMNYQDLYVRLAPLFKALEPVHKL